jgi:serine/threonine-protein kinase 11
MESILINDHNSKPLSQLNQYLLVAKLGSGSCARVHLAVDTTTNNKYAAKAIRLLSTRTSPSALEREIRLMRSLDHPNIVKLHEVLHRSDTNTVYLFMDFASGGALRGRLLSEDVAKIVFAKVLTGLQYLHSRGFVHQDIKPSNILLIEDGEVKLADFGIGHSLQSADSVFGSPAYQAPEFFDEDCEAIDPVKEDLWSVGVSLYESVFGRLPFHGDSVYEIGAAIREQPLEVPASASPELRDLLENLLCVDPGARFGMEQLQRHPWFAVAAAEKVAFQGKPVTMKQAKSCVMIPVNVCRDEYSFAIRTERMASSWPGTIPRQYR